MIYENFWQVINQNEKTLSKWGIKITFGRLSTRRKGTHSNGRYWDAMKIFKIIEANLNLIIRM